MTSIFLRDVARDDKVGDIEQEDCFLLICLLDADSADSGARRGLMQMTDGAEPQEPAHRAHRRNTGEFPRDR